MTPPHQNYHLPVPSSRFGGKGGANAFSLRDSTPADPKGPPFVLFWDIHVWLTDLKIFLLALLAPIYTNFEGERAPKNAIFSRHFPISAVKRFFGLFKNLIPAQKNWSNQGLYLVWDISENQFDRFKKKLTEFSFFF